MAERLIVQIHSDGKRLRLVPVDSETREPCGDSFEFDPRYAVDLASMLVEAATQCGEVVVIKDVPKQITDAQVARAGKRLAIVMRKLVTDGGDFDLAGLEMAQICAKVYS